MYLCRKFLLTALVAGLATVSVLQAQEKKLKREELPPAVEKTVAQAVGRPVDRRSDIFSFGAVLYEMLTGSRAFAGTAAPDVLEAVVKSDPDWYRAYAEKSVLKRWASAEEIVGPTLFLASDAASFVTGTILMADGGWTAA